MITKELKFKVLPLIKINILTGAILQGETWSSTHVSSSGGGGSIHNGSGYISAPTIHSRTTTHQAIWVKDENTQKDIKLNIPSNVDVMQSHKIKYAQLIYNKRVLSVYFENYDTELWWSLDISIKEFAAQVTKTSSKYWRKIFFFIILASLPYFDLRILGFNYLRGITSNDFRNLTIIAISFFVFILGIMYANSIDRKTKESNKKDAEELTALLFQAIQS